MRALCLSCLNKSHEEDWVELKDGMQCPVCGDFQEMDEFEENYGY
jgi:rubredoxin